MTMKHLLLAAAVATSAATAVAADQVVREQNIEIRLAGDATGDLTGLLGGELPPMGSGTAVIVGRAVEADGQRPVPGALVTLRLPGVEPLRVLADGQGRFAYQGLPPGRFDLTAVKAGFAEGAYGRRRPSGPSQSLQLDDGEGVVEVVVPLWRLAAATGRVMDERGEPVIAATVQAFRRTTVGGLPKLSPVATDETDDRGVYRLGLLEPGDYVISIPQPQTSGGQMFFFGGGGGEGARIDVVRRAAVSQAVEAVRGELGGNISISLPENLSGPAGLDADGTPLTYPTQYYANAAIPTRAATLTLGPGEERSGLDFQLAPVRTTTIAGTVLGAEGPAPNITLELLPPGADEFASPILAGTARSGADGAFEFTGVAPGQYTLRVRQFPRMAFGGGETTVISSGGATYAMRSVVRIGERGPAPPLPDEPTRWADVPLSVADRPVHTTVTLAEGLRVTGQVQFSGGATRPEPDQLSSIGITLEPAGGQTSGFDRTARGRVSENGLFETMGVPPGSYFVRAAGAPEGWSFAGATLGGRDVSDRPLEIGNEEVQGVLLTFTDQETELAGSVTTGDGSSASDAIVLIFPASADGWTNYGARPRRLQSARVDETGAFRVGGLPAGEYFVAAVPDELADDWRNPTFLQRLAPQATAVRLDVGQRQSQSLRVVRW